MKLERLTSLAAKGWKDGKRAVTFRSLNRYVRYLKHLVTLSLALLDCLFALHFLPFLVFRWPTTAATGQWKTIQSIMTDWLTACWNVLSPSSLPATNCTLIGVGGGLLIEQMKRAEMYKHLHSTVPLDLFIRSSHVAATQIHSNKKHRQQTFLISLFTQLRNYL